MDSRHCWWTRSGVGGILGTFDSSPPFSLKAMDAVCEHCFLFFNVENLSFQRWELQSLNNPLPALMGMLHSGSHYSVGDTGCKHKTCQQCWNSSSRQIPKTERWEGPALRHHWIIHNVHPATSSVLLESAQFMPVLVNGVTAFLFKSSAFFCSSAQLHSIPETFTGLIDRFWRSIMQRKQSNVADCVQKTAFHLH